MFEVLQTFSRAVLAFLCGAMLIFGTTFWADVFGGKAFDEVILMLGDPEQKIIFTAITAVTAYIIGVINFAVSSVALRSLVSATKDELLLISRIESFQQPQLLKEALELLHVKRTLVAFAFPLIYFGLGLACAKQWPASRLVEIVAGILLTLAGVLGPFLAARITRLLDKTVNELSNRSA